MRAVVQRVAWAKVEIAEEVAGAIDRGLLVYLGVGMGDAEDDRAWMLKKVTGLRVFDNELGKMDKSVVDVGGALLVVSQFTLFGDVSRGMRPSFDAAMAPAGARVMYDAFLDAAAAIVPVSSGRFGADMRVSCQNDGPVTILLDSRQR